MSTPQLDYLISTQNLNYPFRVAATDTRVNQLFADIRVVGKDAFTDAELVMNTVELSGSGFSFTLSDDGSTVFDSDTADEETRSTTNWIINQYSNAAGIRVIVVLNKQVYDDILADGPDINNVQAGLTVQGCLVEVAARKLNSLTIDGQELTDGVQLAAGYNMSMTFTEVAGVVKPRRQIRFDAIPGEGLGRFPSDCSDVNDLLRTINGVPPVDPGAFQLTTTDCHWLEAQPSENALILNNDCNVCLDCEDVIAAYENLTRLRGDAAVIRQRLCDSILVYNDYVSLLERFAESFNSNQLVLVTSQTDFEAFSLLFRMQVGSQAVTKVDVTVSYGPVEVTAEFHEYSFREKIPSFAPRQKLLTTTTPAIPDTGATFDGTHFIYDATGDPSNTALREKTFAHWYWNMHFERSDGDDEVEVTWSATITFADASTTSYGPTVEIINIVPQNSI